jgi:glutaconate CoA-transferase subunit A
LSKVMTMKKAISENVKSGDTIFFGGAQHGVPNAAFHEIVRQRIDHLNVVCVLTAVGLLIGEGLVDKMTTGYVAQNIDASYMLQKAKAAGKLPIFEESSHFGISLMLLAGQMGVPFMPCKVLVGSDMMKYNKTIKSVTDPFGSGKLGAVKAVVPDVGILHVQRADAEGNAQKWGSLGVDEEGINASKKVIIITEKVVDADIIRRDPNRTLIPNFRVNAVVEQPFGAHPSHLAGCYDGDMAFNALLMRGDESYETFVNEFIYGVKDFNGYMEKVKTLKGKDYFESLKIINPVVSEPVIHGWRK